jgi:cysteine desulfurase
MKSRLLTYLDHAATSPVRRSAQDATASVLSRQFGNPSQLYGLGREAASIVAAARASVARLMGVSADHIVFTSGATEANNWVIQSLVRQRLIARRPAHLIVSAVEHQSVLATASVVAKWGARVSVVPCSGVGTVDADSIRAAIAGDTVLVSVMTASNEVGTIQPVEEIGSICRDANVAFHCDAVQSVAWSPGRLPAACMMTMSGHKLGSPKGVGALILAREVELEPLLYGGDQEMGYRSGTENVAAIAGLGAVADEIAEDGIAESDRLRQLRDRLIDGLLAEVPGCQLTGARVNRLPNHASFSVRGVDAALVLSVLDSAGIQASSGSACAARRGERSHVLAAMGLDPLQQAGSLRLTLGWSTTADDIDYALETVPAAIQRVRALMP